MQKLKVLIFFPYSGMGDLLQIHLRNRCIIDTRAQSIDQLIDDVRSRTPDVLIYDWGAETTRQFEKMEVLRCACPNLPIVAYTFYRKSAREAEEKRCKAFLAKVGAIDFQILDNMVGAAYRDMQGGKAAA